MNVPNIRLKERTLVVGLGSSHGDDQAGWKVIEQLELIQLPGVELRRANVPHDIVDWLDGQGTLHLIDACVNEAFSEKRKGNTHRRFEMVKGNGDSKPYFHFRDSSPQCSTMLSIDRPENLRSAGSHQIDSFAVLELASCLKRLPKHVLIWCIPGNHFAPGDTITTDCEAAISSCVVQLSQDLGNA